MNNEEIEVLEEVEVLDDVFSESDEEQETIEQVTEDIQELLSEIRTESNIKSFEEKQDDLEQITENNQVQENKTEETTEINTEPNAESPEDKLKKKEELKKEKEKIKDTNRIERISNKIEKNKNKIKKKISFKKKLQLIILSCIVLISVTVISIIMYNYYKGLNKVTIENYEFYQYFSGIRYDYKGELTLKKNGEITKLKYKNIEIEVDSTPIYYKTIDNQIIIPQNMGLYMPRMANKNYKLPYFSVISIEETDTNTNAYVKYKNIKKFIEPAFLYDGSNLYVFLYNTKIKIDDEEILLSPLSYIIVNYQDEIFIYDKKTDTPRTIQSHVQDVVAEFEGYKVNLSTDMIMYDSNSKLLIKNVDLLKSYTDEE